MPKPTFKIELGPHYDAKLQALTKQVGFEHPQGLARLLIVNQIESMLGAGWIDQKTFRQDKEEFDTPDPQMRTSEYFAARSENITKLSEDIDDDIPF